MPSLVAPCQPRQFGLVKLLCLLVVLCAAFASAQTILDPSQLPSCALTCPLLTQAQSACVPPAAPTTDQATYQSCFCQSGYLVNLKLNNGGDGGVCDSVCTSSDDQTKIRTWYSNLCNSGTVVTPSSASTMATSTSASSTSTSTDTSSSVNGSTPVDESQPWFATHWKWVVMVIIIFLAIVFFSVGGVWLKRRIHRKRDAQRGNMAAADAYFNRRPPPAAVPHPAPASTSASKGAGMTQHRSPPAALSRQSMGPQFFMQRTGGTAYEDDDEIQRAPPRLDNPYIRPEASSSSEEDWEKQRARPGDFEKADQDLEAGSGGLAPLGVPRQADGGAEQAGDGDGEGQVDDTGALRSGSGRRKKRVKRRLSRRNSERAPSERTR